MVHLTKIYTKTGDDGTTALADNTRTAKFTLVMEAIGAVDEANSAIGMCPHNDIIDRIQNDLFDVGADIAGAKVTITQDRIDWLENVMDDMNEYLQPLNSFVLPTGPIHFARTIVRRAERAVWSWMALDVETHASREVNPLLPVYLNRLSDLLFIMARYNNMLVGEKLWKPMGEGFGYQNEE